MNITPNEPAFAIPNEAAGLTKREYFAALAMQALVSGGNLDKFRPGVGTAWESLPASREAIIASTVTVAVSLADALIKTLNQQPE